MATSLDQHSTSRAFTAGLCLALVGLCIAAYHNVGQLPFLSWDDQVYITENTIVQQGLTWEGLSWAWNTEHAHNRHPLTWFSHMLDCELFGSDDASGHHSVNLAFHIANTVLLFVVFLRMTGQVWPSAFVAALFAVHPLNVESVAWVAERKNVLSTLFWLLVMLAYCEYVRKPRWLPYVAALIAMAFGLLAKQMLVTLPCVLLLLDYWPFARYRGRERWANHTYPAWIVRVVEKLPLAVLSVAASIIVMNVQELAKATWEDLPLSQRLANSAVSYVGYLYHAAWPLNLSVHYLHPRHSLSPAIVIASLGTLLAITLVILFPLRHLRYLTVGWLWYLGTLVPVIGLIQVGEQAMADRYAYVPLIGIWMMLAFGLVDLVRWKPSLRLATTTLAIVWLLSLTFLAQKQVAFWRGEIPLWQHALEVDENNYRAHVELAVALRREGRLEESLSHYDRAAQLEPHRVEVHTNFAEALILAGQTEAAEAPLREALRIAPESVVAHYWLGVLLIEQERSAHGVAELRIALTRLREASEQGLPIEVAELDILYNLAVGLIAAGQYEDAIEAFSQAFRLAPDDVDVRQGLAASHYQLARRRLSDNRPDSAIQHLRAAVKAQPGWIEPIFYLAQVLATSPDETVRDGKEALQLALQVCQATNFENPQALEVLAAAYAESGDFEQAIRLASKALELARNRDEAAMAKRIQSEIEQYKLQEPVRNLSLE